MPSNIFHYQFSQDVLAALPSDLAAVVATAPNLYAAGAQGPDLLFYMKNFKDTPQNILGEALHDRTDVDVLFLQSCRYAKAANDPRLVAFLMGQLCHYALDKEVHPYVYYRENDAPNHYKKAAKTNVHMVFESELDWFWVKEKMGKNPRTYKGRKNLKISKKEGEFLTRYYVDVVLPYIGLKVSPKLFLRSFRLFRFALGAFDDSTGLKYPFYRMVEKMAFKGDMFITAFMRPKKPNPTVDALNSKHTPYPKHRNIADYFIADTVFEMAQKAQQNAVELIKNFAETLKDEGAFCESLYDRNYCGDTRGQGGVG